MFSHGLTEVCTLAKRCGPMAENESLDLKSPQARRWFPVLDAVRKGASCKDVGTATLKALSRAIRNALRQFEGYGLTTADFLANRASPDILSDLMRRTKGHPYAEHLVSVLVANSDAPPRECLGQWLRSILDTVFDQIMLKTVGSKLLPSFLSTRVFIGNVRDEIRNGLETMADKLDDDPHWRPSPHGKKGEPKSDPTAELLSMSLVG